MKLHSSPRSAPAAQTDTTAEVHRASAWPLLRFMQYKSLILFPIKTEPIILRSATGSTSCCHLYKLREAYGAQNTSSKSCLAPTTTSNSKQATQAPSRPRSHHANVAVGIKSVNGSSSSTAPIHYGTQNKDAKEQTGWLAIADIGMDLLRN